MSTRNGNAHDVIHTTLSYLLRGGRASIHHCLLLFVVLWTTWTCWYGWFHTTSTYEYSTINGSMSSLVLQRNVPLSDSLRNVTVSPSNATDTKTLSKHTQLSHSYFTSINKCGHCPLSSVKPRNAILYLGKSHWQAGWLDRSYVLEQLSQLAGFLHCANLYVPPPNVLLAPFHNQQQKRLDPHLQWDDFLHVAYQHDTTTSAQETVAVRELLINTSTYHQTSDPEAWNLTNLVSQYVTRLQTLHSNMTVVRVITRQSGQLARHLQHLQSILQSQRYNDSNSKVFVWGIDVGFWKFKDKLLRYIRQQEQQQQQNGKVLVGDAQQYIRSLPYLWEMSDPSESVGHCQYVTMQMGPFIGLVAERLWEHIVASSQASNVSQNLYGLLHVRRGDARASCDTSIPTMLSYLHCMWDQTIQHDNATNDRKGQIMTTILLATDEPDPCYRNAVTNIVTGLDQSRGHVVAFIDLDSLAWQVMESVISESKDENHQSLDRFRNNYHIFQLIQYVKEQVDFHWERRRAFACQDCVMDNVVVKERLSVLASDYRECRSTS